MFEITNWIHSPQGSIHFISSLIGLVTGAYLLIATKGTRFHKRVGYLFSISLVLVNLTALLIYDFNNGSVGPFHFLIPVSLFFLAYGFIPMFRKKRGPKALNKHIIGMIGASLGLWAAGATEYYMREMVTAGMSKEMQIFNSFLVSLPFAILITVLITYHLRQLKEKPIHKT